MLSLLNLVSQCESGSQGQSAERENVLYTQYKFLLERGMQESLHH